MLRYHRGKYYDEYMTHFSKDSFDLRLKEHRDSCTWSEIILSNEDTTIGYLKLAEKMAEKYLDICEIFSNKVDNLSIVDVGCAEGMYSFLPLHHFSKLQIIAFEPDIVRAKIFMEMYDVFKEKYHYYDWNNNIHIDLFDCVIGDGNSEVSYLRHYECEKTGGGAGSSTTSKIDRPNKKSVDIKSESIKLDDLTAICEKVDILKIDVEGGELSVLEGAKNFINTYRPIIFLEVHLGPIFGNVDQKQIFNIINQTSVEFKISWKQFEPLDDNNSLVYYILIPLHLLPTPTLETKK